MTKVRQYAIRFDDSQADHIVMVELSSDCQNWIVALGRKLTALFPQWESATYSAYDFLDNGALVKTINRSPIHNSNVIIDYVKLA